MIDVHSKYDDMLKNGMFYALICINDRLIACEICMLSIGDIEKDKPLCQPNLVDWPTKSDDLEWCNQFECFDAASCPKKGEFFLISHGKGAFKKHYKKL